MCFIYMPGLGPGFFPPASVIVKEALRFRMLNRGGGVPHFFSMMVDDLVIQNREQPGAWIAFSFEFSDRLKSGQESFLHKVLRRSIVLNATAGPCKQAVRIQFHPRFDGTVRIVLDISGYRAHGCNIRKNPGRLFFYPLYPGKLTLPMDTFGIPLRPAPKFTAPPQSVSFASTANSTASFASGLI